MAKAYLNIHICTAGDKPTVERLVFSDKSALEIPTESLGWLWATVDEYEAPTLEEAERKIRERFHRAVKKLSAFRALEELLDEPDWEPELSDALGG